MGCWNGTDLLTQLPINCGDKVRLCLLGSTFKNVYSKTDINHGQLELNGGGSTSIHSPWSIILPPVQAIYDDCGMVTKIKSGVSKDMMHDFLKNAFILSDKEEIDRIEGYRPLSKIQSLPVYLRAIERGYGCYRTYSNKFATLGFALILEDVYQAALSYNPIDCHADWSNLNNPISLYMPWHKHLEDHMQKWYARTLEAFAKIEVAKTEEEKIAASVKLAECSENKVFTDHKSLCGRQFVQNLTKQIKDKRSIDDKTVQAMFKAFKEVLLLDGFMDMTRKFYSPQCGAGSQSYDYEPYVLLNKCVTDIIAKAKKRDEEENVPYEPDENGYYDYMIEHNKKEMDKIKNV